MTARRQIATEAETDKTLEDLDGAPGWMAATDWAERSRGQTPRPGLYAWRTDLEGARQLTESLDQAIAAGRIYAGQAGATKWPSGKVGRATLTSRIGGQHIGGRVRGSTFRLTLASALRSSLGLVSEGPRRLT